MAITRAGQTALRLLERVKLFAPLIAADPSAEQVGLVPWDGRSPRSLTEAHERFILGHEGASLNEVDAQIDEQCRRHLHGW